MAEGRFSGKYQLGDRIGGGGMAEVFRATVFGAEGFTRSVAIKRVLDAYSSDATFAEMFANEARIASVLSHPNIVSVVDFDRDPQGRLFLVMELVEGADLRGVLKQGGLSLPLALYVISEVLRALVFAHDAPGAHGQRLEIVHRDVSPHNILLSWDGAVKLSDFGIAKAVEATRVTKTGIIKGKLGYMSPEQAEGAKLDRRSDLFAVGIILYELLTHRRLFVGDSDRAVLNRILIAPIDPPSTINPAIPPEVDAICMRLLERELNDRYQWAAEPLEALLATDLIPARAQLDLAALIHERIEPVTAVDTPEADVATTRLLTEPAEGTASNTQAPPPPRTGRAWLMMLLPLTFLAGLLATMILTRSEPTEVEPLPPPAVRSTRLTSTPPGAQVKIDGRVAGNTPHLLQLPPGKTAAVELSLEGHRTTSRELRAGTDLHVELQSTPKLSPDAGSAPPRRKKRKKKQQDGILRPDPEKRIGDGILAPSCLSILLLLLIAGPARGETDAQRAMQLFEEGTTAYNLGHFKEAIQRFEEAYAAHPAPAFIFNLAQAHRQLRQCERASFFYRRFLEMEPEATNRTEVRGFINDMDRCAAEEPPPPGPPPDPPPPAPVPPPPPPPPNVEIVVDRDAPFFSATVEAGLALVTFGNLPTKANFRVRAVAAVPIRSGNFWFEPGVSFALSPQRYRTSDDKRTVILSDMLVNVALGFVIIDRFRLRLELGAGALLLSKLAQGNPFTENQAPTSGPISMFSFRAGLGADVALSEHVFLSISPLSFAISPPKGGLVPEIDNVRTLAFLAGATLRL